MIEYTQRLGIKFIEACKEIVEFLNTSFNIGSINLSVLEIIFGSGIIIVLGIIIAKWLI